MGGKLSRCCKAAPELEPKRCVESWLDVNFGKSNRRVSNVWVFGQSFGKGTPFVIVWYLEDRGTSWYVSGHQEGDVPDSALSALSSSQHLECPSMWVIRRTEARWLIYFHGRSWKINLCLFLIFLHRLNCSHRARNDTYYRCKVRWLHVCSDMSEPLQSPQVWPDPHLPVTD